MTDAGGGLFTSVGAGTGTGTGADTGASGTRGRTPFAITLTETIRENAADVDVEADAVLSLRDDGREDDDDFPTEDETPDLGAADDDEPFIEQADERPAARPSRPEIELWSTNEGIQWEVRPVSAALAADDELLALAARREQVLERYAEGLAADLLDPRWLVLDPARADLPELWDALPVRNPADPYDPLRWNTQTAMSERWNVDASTMSRDRDLLVRLPSGRVVPLAFFSWKTENDDLVRAIAAADGLFTASIAAIAASITAQSGPQRSAKDFVPWVRASLRHPEPVRRANEHFRVEPARSSEILSRLQEELTAAETERVSREGGAALGKQDRALPVLHRALIGMLR